MRTLSYDSLEIVRVGRPVDRLKYIADLCRGKFVLDIGCLDETALQKRDTVHWLHGRVQTVAREVIGIDSSALIPSEGLRTGANAIILKGDGADPALTDNQARAVEVIVAGEFIEHLCSPSTF